MGVFGRKGAGRPAAGVFTDVERERIDALWRLTALPRDEFEATYGEMLTGLWRCVARAAGMEWIVLRDGALACALAALKVRQARIVPRFAPVEDAARLAEVMSFALAACVVSERFAGVLGRAAAPRWSPLDGDVPAEAVLSQGPVPRAFGALVLARFVGAARPRVARPGARGAVGGGGPTSGRAKASCGRSPARRRTGSGCRSPAPSRMRPRDRRRRPGPRRPRRRGPGGRTMDVRLPLGSRGPASTKRRPRSAASARAGSGSTGCVRG